MDAATEGDPTEERPDPRESLAVYLNDHLAGATGGTDLIAGMAERHADDAAGPFLERLAREIDEDRETLTAVMEELGIDKNPVKQGLAWAGEKLGRFKLGDFTAGPEGASDLMELETMSLGVAGKLSLWQSLERAGITAPSLDLPRLIERAKRQRAGLEEHRLEIAGRVLG